VIQLFTTRHFTFVAETDASALDISENSPTGPPAQTDALHRIGSSIVQTMYDQIMVLGGGTASCPGVLFTPSWRGVLGQLLERASAIGVILRPNIQDVQFKVFMGKIIFWTVFPVETSPKDEEDRHSYSYLAPELIAFRSDIKSQRLRFRCFGCSSKEKGIEGTFGWLQACDLNHRLVHRFASIRDETTRARVRVDCRQNCGGESTLLQQNSLSFKHERATRSTAIT